MANGGVRKRLPKSIAVIDPDSCTGCDSCREVCPVDCINLIQRGLRVKGTETWCEIDIERCIGCEICIRIPQRKSVAYELKVCPWDAIEMVPTQQLVEAVTRIGGPSDYVDQNRAAMVAAAQRLEDLARAQ